MAAKRVTICVLGARAAPGGSGGVEAHCEALYPRLAARNPDRRFVIIARRTYSKAKRQSFGGVEVIATYAPKHRYFEAAVHTLFGVFNARFGQGAKVVHFHAIGPGLFAPLAKLLGMRVIVTHHSRNYLHAKWNAIARRVLRLGEWSAARFADRVIAVSPSLAQELRTRMPRRAEAIAFIPNGATQFPEADDAARELLGKLGLAPGAYVLAVGRITPEKGFHDLVHAFAKAATDKRLLIVGSADHEDAYSRKLKEQADARVIFAGFQNRAAIGHLLRNAALFALPSHHEGMPIAALEALSQGAPILMSDIPANVDLGLPVANYFPVGDIDALAAGLSGDLARYRFDATQMMRRYAWDEIAAQTGAVYDSMLAKQKRPS